MIMVVFSQRLDSVILEVFSNTNDFMVKHQNRLPSFLQNLVILSIIYGLDRKQCFIRSSQAIACTFDILCAVNTLQGVKGEIECIVENVYLCTLKKQFPSIKGNQASHISPPRKPPVGKVSATFRRVTLEDVQVMICQQSFLTEMSSLKIGIIIGKKYEFVLTTQRGKRFV